MPSTVAILVIFFNKLSQTIECIDSFLPSGQNIYVLNNGSKPATWQLLKRQYDKNGNVLFFHSSENIGPARGRNILLKKCKEEWIFLVDNDICIKPAQKWKNLFDERVEAEKEAKIFCPRLYNVHDDNYAKQHVFSRINNVIRMEETELEVSNFFPCGAVIVHRTIFNIYGNFDDQLFAFEDYEFSIRALCSPQGAFKVYPLPEIELVHDHRFQQKHIDKQAVLERYNEKKIQASMQRIMDKHLIIFDHDWRWWTRKQISNMNAKSFVGKIKDKVLTYLKKN